MPPFRQLAFDDYGVNAMSQAGCFSGYANVLISRGTDLLDHQSVGFIVIEETGGRTM
ncbi:MAG TPA: hypothetical protein VMU68_04125 [Acidimicrobiales bacterium]|nr:hypothetical protein [Acidimicrobiales bacterium]